MRKPIERVRITKSIQPNWNESLKGSLHKLNSLIFHDFWRSLSWFLDKASSKSSSAQRIMRLSRNHWFEVKVSIFLFLFMCSFIDFSVLTTPSIFYGLRHNILRVSLTFSLTPSLHHYLSTLLLCLRRLKPKERGVHLKIYLHLDGIHPKGTVDRIAEAQEKGDFGLRTCLVGKLWITDRTEGQILLFLWGFW